MWVKVIICFLFIDNIFLTCLKLHSRLVLANISSEENLSFFWNLHNLVEAGFAPKNIDAFAI